MPIPGGPPASVVSLTDVKSYLRLTTANNDSMLQKFLDAATQQADFWFGPVLPRTVTEWHDGGKPVVTLRQPPVLSITSVTEFILNTPYPLTAQPLDAGAVTQWGYTFEPSASQLTRRVNALAATFAVGIRNVEVIYIAGRASVPGDIYLAMLEDIRGLWQQTQQGGRPEFGGAQESDWTIGPMHQFPRLKALADASQQLPGIA